MQGQNQFFMITIFLVVTLSIFHSGETLQCYKERKKGNETFLSEQIAKCSTPGWTCLTHSRIIDQDRVDYRGCVFKGFCELIAYLVPHDGTIDCKECSTSLCNTSAN